MYFAVILVAAGACHRGSNGSDAKVLDEIDIIYQQRYEQRIEEHTLKDKV